MVSASRLTLFDVQVQKFRKRGLRNNLLALCLLTILFVGCHHLGHQMWNPYVMPIVKLLGQRTFVITAGCFIHTVTAIGSLLFFLPTYMGLSSWLDEYRIDKTSSWHWSRTSWSSLKQKTINNLLLVHFVYFPIGLYIGSGSLKVQFERFPTISEYFVQMLFLTYIDDFCFFWIHRTLHMPWFYKHIHKQHHEYDTPFSSVAQYAHPVEYFIGNMFRSSLGIFMLGNRLHAFTYLMFIVHKIFVTCETHSGFDIPWTPMVLLPFSNPSTHHDFHHSNNVGTYGGFTYLWDHLTGNNLEYYKSTFKYI